MHTWCAGMSMQALGRHTRTAISPFSPLSLLLSGRISARPMYRSIKFFESRSRVSAALGSSTPRTHTTTGVKNEGGKDEGRGPPFFAPARGRERPLATQNYALAEKELKNSAATLPTFHRTDWVLLTPLCYTSGHLT